MGIQGLEAKTVRKEHQYSIALWHTEDSWTESMWAMHNKQAPPPVHMCQPSVYLASLELMKSPYLHTGSDQTVEVMKAWEQG